MNNKRHFPRVHLTIAVDCQDYLESKKIAAHSKNISQGGICLTTRETLPEYGHVELAFHLPDGVHIKAIGEVRWSHALSDATTVSGLSFTDIRKEDVEKIKQFVDKELASTYGGQDRRSAKRILIGIVVDFISAEAEVKNLSERGMCISSSEEYEIGKQADMMFFLPVNVAIKAVGRVVWAKETGRDLYDYGIEFMEINTKHIDTIKKYIAENE